MERDCCPTLDGLIGRRWSVLDKGYVELWDYMGNERSITRAARTSLAIEKDRTLEQDISLLRHLFRHRHTSPFEMCELKLRLHMPIFVARQWVRHRMASLNEMSLRYSEAKDDFHLTAPDGWRLQDQRNKQGSIDVVLPEELGRTLCDQEVGQLEEVYQQYERRIAAGVAREQARKDLPVSLYTTIVWKIDAHNLIHFLALRMDSHAQKEIRVYADLIGQTIFSEWLPNVWQAFVDFRLEAMTLSRLDIAVLSAPTPQRKLEVAAEHGWLKRTYEGKLRPNSERSECIQKARRLGIDISWLEKD